GTGSTARTHRGAVLPRGRCTSSSVSSSKELYDEFDSSRVCYSPRGTRNHRRRRRGAAGAGDDQVDRLRQSPGAVRERARSYRRRSAIPQGDRGLPRGADAVERVAQSGGVGLSESGEGTDRGRQGKAPALAAGE